MPCWTVCESKVNLDKADTVTLTKALRDLGFHVNDATYSARYGAKVTADRFSDRTSVKLMNDGSVSVTSGTGQANLDALGAELKRAYSTQVVQDAAKRFGWTLTPTGDNKWKVMGRG